MSNYYCVCCDYDAKVKSSFDKHLKTKKHIRAMESQPKVNQKSTSSQQLVNLFDDPSSQRFKCHYCEKDFKYKQGMYRHMKYTCTKNTDKHTDKLKSIIKAKDKDLKEKEETIEKLKNQIVGFMQILNSSV